MIGDRLQELLDDSGLAGAEATQEGLEEAGSKLYLGGGRA